MKRYRKRKRRRVIAVIPIEIFEDDLALLERFDYLSVPAKEGSKEPDFADEWVTPEAIGDAVQAFLLHAFLTHTEAPSYPWAERIKRQRQRIRALTELNLGEAQDEEQDTSQK